MTFAAEYEPHLRRVERLAQDITSHAPAVTPLTAAYLADLAGLLTTAYVAAFECCTKSIFLGFASSKGKLLASVTAFHFEKLNSKISRSDLEKYARQYSIEYEKILKDSIEQMEMETLQHEKRSMKETYKNLLTWRHEFVHAGNQLATLQEVVESYSIAKKMVVVLDQAMSTDIGL